MPAATLLIGNRAGAAIQHEHACARCPMLRISPSQAPRLLEIERNTHERLSEARQMQWLGDVAALEESLRHIAKKKDQIGRLRAQADRAETARQPLPDWSATAVEAGMEPQQPGFALAEGRARLVDQAIEFSSAIPARSAIGGGRLPLKPRREIGPRGGTQRLIRVLHKPQIRG
jgi:hypothetical protein